MAYEYICDGGLDPVVPARVLGGVSIGVVSRTVGDAGSFAGRSLEEELADSVFLTVPRLEEEEAASPRLKMLSESTANSQPCCSSALWQCTVLPRGLWIVGMLATANYWGRCRARLILVSSSHVEVDVAAKASDCKLGSRNLADTVLLKIQPWR